MYVLDTNAFYYASEISTFSYSLDKLQRLISENEIFISSTSLFEFFIKYRNELATIHKGLRYIIDNKIKIVGNVINPLPDDFDISNITEEKFTTICSEILENKVEVESCFVSVVFLMCLFSGYYFILDPPTDTADDFATYVMSTTFKKFSEEIPAEFKTIFEEGYKINDCENYVKKRFYELLGALLVTGIPAIELAKKNGTDEKIATDEWLSADLFSLKMEKMKSKLKNKTSNKLLQNISNNYKKTHSKKQYRHVIENLSSIFNSKIKYTALQEYTYDILIGILEHGMALWKNDLLDAIILCNLQDQHVLITYDKELIKRMIERQGQHEKYRQSVEIIAELKK